MTIPVTKRIAKQITRFNSFHILHTCPTTISMVSDDLPKVWFDEYQTYIFYSICKWIKLNMKGTNHRAYTDQRCKSLLNRHLQTSKPVILALCSLSLSLSLSHTHTHTHTHKRRAHISAIHTNMKQERVCSSMAMDSQVGFGVFPQWLVKKKKKRAGKRELNFLSNTEPLLRSRGNGLRLERGSPKVQIPAKSNQWL